MSLKEYLRLRGQQVTVGDVVIQIPSTRPKTDAEIADREELIDEVDEAALEARDTVKLAKTVMNGLRHDLSVTANRRRKGLKEEAELFDGQPPAGDDATKVTVEFSPSPLIPGEKKKVETTVGGLKRTAETLKRRAGKASRRKGAS